GTRSENVQAPACPRIRGYHPARPDHCERPAHWTGPSGVPRSSRTSRQKCQANPFESSCGPATEPTRSKITRFAGHATRRCRNTPLSTCRVRLLPPSIHTRIETARHLHDLIASTNPTDAAQLHRSDISHELAVGDVEPHR